MINLIWMIVASWIPVISHGVDHPFHVSNTEFNYNQTDKNLEVTCKIFTDDFERALNLFFKQKADFTDLKLTKQMNLLVPKYLKTHLAVNVNGKWLDLSCLGYEIDHESVNVYLEHPMAEVPKKIEIQNTLAYEAYTDQVGIVHFIVQGKRITNKLTYPEKSLKFEF
ncbi:MAG TPA: hypothetical protein PLU58_05715 [Saprospiraceae bacterium]|nr:hypothetical protein [Saprospiraceae bacterium]